IPSVVAINTPASVHGIIGFETVPPPSEFLDKTLRSIFLSSYNFAVVVEPAITPTYAELPNILPKNAVNIVAKVNFPLLFLTHLSKLLATYLNIPSWSNSPPKPSDKIIKAITPSIDSIPPVFNSSSRNSELDSDTNPLSSEERRVDKSHSQ